jgi:hypothetical protein
MPRKSESKTESPQKHRLTLAELASYDDVLTDALVDQVEWRLEHDGASLTSHRHISGREYAKIARTNTYLSEASRRIKYLKSSSTKLS